MLSFPRLSLTLSIVLGFFLPVKSTIAADQIILKYGIIRGSIPVQDLNIFCETGEVSNTLGYYLRWANQKQDNIEKTLCKQIPVNGVMLSKILNSPFGEVVLDLFAEVITTPSQKASRESLRGAVITSALKENNISILEVANNYPTQEVHINGDRLMEIYKQIEEVLTTFPVGGIIHRF